MPFRSTELYRQSGSDTLYRYYIPLHQPQIQRPQHQCRQQQQQQQQQQHRDECTYGVYYVLSITCRARVLRLNFVELIPPL